MHAYNYLASTYGSSSYDSTTYNGATTSTGSPSGTSTSGGSNNLLTNTGFDIAVVATLAAIIMLSAIVVRVWKRSSN